MSRWNNSLIDGIEETTNETWEDCEIKIKELIKDELKMNEHIKIDLCHRLSRMKSQNRPFTIFYRITKFKEKQKILKNTKLSKILVFSTMRISLRHDEIEQKTGQKCCSIESKINLLILITVLSLFVIMGVILAVFISFCLCHYIIILLLRLPLYFQKCRKCKSN